MKSLSKIYLLIAPLIFSACQQAEQLDNSFYDCSDPWQDSSLIHPRADQYQEILNRHVKEGIVGGSLAIIDEYGLWTGVAGSADLVNDVEVKTCNPFLIASISKVFTATSVFHYVDEGLLKLNDPISKYLDPEIIRKVDNADEAEIRHLLSHTSGLPDYYSLIFEMDRINKTDNDFTQEEILEYTYPLKPTNKVGESYWYSNTNYLLLGIILEKVSGLSLSQVYQESIFDPAGLSSAYYGTKESIPGGAVKGYVDIYGNGKVVESKFLYQDELGTGDGGIAITSADLAQFFRQLMQGNLISENSLAMMTDWFPLPEGWEDENIGHFMNGYGLEYNRTPYGNSVGHTGGIDGFLSIAQYWEESGYAFVLLSNTGTYDNQARLNIYRECMEVMFGGEG